MKLKELFNKIEAANELRDIAQFAPIFYIGAEVDGCTIYRGDRGDDAYQWRFFDWKTFRRRIAKYWSDEVMVAIKERELEITPSRYLFEIECKDFTIRIHVYCANEYYRR